MTEPHPAVEQRAGVRIVRVGRGPDPLAFVPLQHQTWAGRFDDPEQVWRTLYAASDEHGAWVEVLGRFRSHAETQAELEAVTSEPGDSEPVRAGTVSLAWLASRMVGSADMMARVADLAVAATLRWLDLRPAIRHQLDAHGIDELDLSAATSRVRAVTQAVARELRLHAEADAVEYPSRYGAPTTCYALFETTGNLPLVEPVGKPRGVDLKGTPLAEAMALHGLQWDE